MKTTFYIPFVLVNTTTRNYLLGITKSDNEEFLDTIKREDSYTMTNSTLRDYVLNHPESYSKVSSFVETLKYFGNQCFIARYLGAFIEHSEAEQCIQIAQDNLLYNPRKRPYYHECYNLKASIENEVVEQQKIARLANKMKEKSEKYEKQGLNNKSEVKKQHITIIEIESGEEHYFDTKGECMKFLGCATDTFSRFLKGNTKLNKKYKVKPDSSLKS